MKQKLTSRKFWMAVCSALFIVITEGLGVDVPAATYWGLVSVISAYILGESLVDVSRSFK